jgi:hypothetical protein
VKPINALYVEKDGVYSSFCKTELWDIERDARKCRNGLPAVCHPPCERWGRYWSGGPSAKNRRILGDDGGCFAHALWYARTFGGIIEHPEASHAWKFYGLSKPPKEGGWVKADDYGGYTCCVEQGHYGHKARKATWLYANKVELFEFIWGKSEGKLRIDQGFHSKERALQARNSANYKPIKRLSAQERIDTPVEFAQILVKMVRGN